MKRILNLVMTTLLVIGSYEVMAQPSANHYAGLDGKSGETLLQAISSAAGQGYSTLTYKQVWSAYEKTDCRPETNTIWDMYSLCTFTYGTDQDDGTSTNEECAFYNREHSIPKSWWGGSEDTSTDPQYTNIFHLIPTDKHVNAVRGNNPFSEVSNPSTTFANGSKLGTSSFSGYSGTAYEPIDEYKGDLARGVLATMVQHQANYTYSEGANVFNNNYTASGNFGLTTFAKNLFLKWHRQDPVSQKELDRNNGIEETQGNRNPFIDYPDLVEYIWGDKQGETVTLSTLSSSYGDVAPGEPKDELTAGKYVVLARRSESANYFYMTAELTGGVNVRYKAENSIANTKYDVKTQNLEDKYIWEVVENGSTIRLKNGTQYSSWSSGNTAILDDTGKDLNVKKNSNGTFTLSFDTRYLSLNKTEGNDYFAYYTTGQITELLFLPYGVAITPSTTPVTGVSLSASNLTMNIGDVQLLTATVAPNDATNKKVSWSSSAPEVVSVTSLGKLTALAAGKATITVTTEDGKKTATCAVTVTETTTEPITVRILVEKSLTRVHVYTDDNDTVFYDDAPTLDAQNWYEYTAPAGLAEFTLKLDNRYTTIIKKNGCYKYNLGITQIDCDSQEELPASFNIVPEQLIVYQGDTVKIEIESCNVDIDRIRWSRSSMFSRTGNSIVGKIPGETWLHGEVSSIKDSVYIIVEEKPAEMLDPMESITLSKTQLIMRKGSSYAQELQVTITGTNCANEVEWSYSRPNIVKYEDGNVTMLVEDTVTIYAKDPASPLFASCKVLVALTGIGIEQTTYNVPLGGTQQINMTYKPANAWKQQCTYVSADPSIATVDANGVITGVALGITEITATSVVGNYRASCTVNVVNASYGSTFKLVDWEYAESEHFADINGDGALEALILDNGVKWIDMDGNKVLHTEITDGLSSTPYVHDFNNDGIPDLLSPTTLVVSKNGTYEVKKVDISFPIVQCADFNRDGREDILAYKQIGDDEAYNIPYIWIQLADGTFTARPFDLVTEDIDNVYAEYQTGSDGSYFSTVPFPTFDPASMHKAPARKSVSTRAASASNDPFGQGQALDMNMDGYPDIIGNGSYVSLPDGRYYHTAISGGVTITDFNNDGAKDMVIFNSPNVDVWIVNGNTVDKSTLYSNTNISNVICEDLDNDGKTDILLLAPTEQYFYMLFFRNNGDGTFTKTERALKETATASNWNRKFEGVFTFDNGTPSVVVSEGYYTIGEDGYKSPIYKRIDWNSSFTLKETALCGNDSLVYIPVSDSENVFIRDFKGDGYLYALLLWQSTSGMFEDEYVSGSGVGLYQASTEANTKPTISGKPNVIVDKTNGLVKVEWAEGIDAETATTDLDYEVRVRKASQTGEASGLNWIQYMLLQKTSGANSLIFDPTTWAAGDYVVDIRAIDLNRAVSAWSEGTTFTNAAKKAEVVLNQTNMTLVDTLVVQSVTGETLQIDALPDGRILSNENGVAKIMFADMGDKEIIAHIANGQSTRQTVYVRPFKKLNIETYYDPPLWDVFDLNQDGKAEGWKYVQHLEEDAGIFIFNNGVATQNPNLSMSDVILNEGNLIDKNRDGQPDFAGPDISKTGVSYSYLINNGGLDFTPENAPYTIPYFMVGDLDNNGCVDYMDQSGSLNLYENQNYASLKTHSLKTILGNNNLTFVTKFFARDLNNDGYLDLVLVATGSTSENAYHFYVLTNKGNFKFDVQDIAISTDWENDYPQYREIVDVNGDGLLDIYYRNSKYIPSAMKSELSDWAIYQNANGKFGQPVKLTRIALGFDFDNDGRNDYAEGRTLILDRADGEKTMSLDEENKSTAAWVPTVASGKLGDYCELIDWTCFRYAFDYYENGFPSMLRGYATEGNTNDFHLHTTYSNTAPQAPTAVYVNQTNDKVVVSWEGASDKESQLGQLRYNISIREKGTKNYVISPLNATKNEALTIYPGYEHYRTATTFPLPITAFTADKTYEICVQTIDSWYAHSDFSQVVEFTPAAELLIYLPAKGGVDVPVPFSYASNTATPSIVADGGGVVSGNTITWNTAGTKTVTAIAGDIITKQTIVIVEKPDLTLALPELVLSETELLIDLPIVEQGNLSVSAAGLQIQQQNDRIKTTIPALSEGKESTTYTFVVTYKDEIFGTLTEESSLTAVENIQPEIRMLTVENNAIRITWETSETLTALHNGKVRIYRETSIADKYELIATANYADGTYLDKTATPDVRSSRYVIALTTTDGSEGKYSTHHTSIHTMINQGMGNDVNLHWTHYEGASVAQYTILSGSSPENLSVLENISGNAQSYTHKRTTDADTYYALSYTLKSAMAAPAVYRAAASNLEGRSNVICSNEAYNVTLVESITISSRESNMTLTNKQPELHLLATISPVRATLGRVAWSITEGNEYATIAPDGTLTLTAAHSASGIIIVQAAAIDGSEVTDTKEIAFSYTAAGDIAVTGVSLNQNSLTLAIGDTYTLTATVTPSNATNKTVRWSSSAPNVVTVQDGFITALSEGNATITVTTVDGLHTATCNITVITGTAIDNVQADDMPKVRKVFEDGIFYIIHPNGDRYTFDGRKVSSK